MNKVIVLLALFTINSFASIIPYPFHDVQKTENGQNNYLTSLNSGIASFQARINLIRSAQFHIEVEYFIYALDDSSQIFTQELVKAAKRGVKVRILVDKSSTIFQLDGYYAKALSEAGIELRYYNAAAIIRVSSINFRNHRKLLSVDDKIAITGGRNIEDDYFDISPHYNFLDRDLIVEGPIVKTMRASFEKYYNNKITQVPRFPSMPPKFRKKRVRGTKAKRIRFKKVSNTKAINEHLARTKKAKEFLSLTNEQKELQERMESIATPILNTKTRHLCPETTYTTDRPGGNFQTRLKKNYGRDFRYLRKTLFEKISKINNKILFSSPYMLNNGKTRKLLNSLLDRDIDVTLYTNSLAATDAAYVAANFYKDIFRWIRKGLDVFIHSGEFIKETEIMSPKIEQSIWGTHSKTHIYDSIDPITGKEISEVMVGTYNIDNRSNYYNAEMAIFCKGSPSFTEEVRTNIEARIAKSYKLNGNRTATDNEGNTVSRFGKDAKTITKMRLLAIPSYLLKFLL